MGSTRRVATTFAIVAAMGVALIGVTAAVAQQDDEPVGADTASLLARLGELESVLPSEVPPTGVTLSDDESDWTLEGDAGSVRAVLDTLEPDLRLLFVDADDVPGEDVAASAVVLVTRGWLDIWQGTAALAAYESHDLAFPVTGTSDDGVATGADELRGSATAGLELILQGRERLHLGYTALRVTGQAEPDVQARFDTRAADEDAFDQDLRPVLLHVLARPTSSVLVPTERFNTSAPGVEARANSLTLACVDRTTYNVARALESVGENATADALDVLSMVAPERVDCPDLPNDSEVRESR